MEPRRLAVLAEGSGRPPGERTERLAGGQRVTPALAGSSILLAVLGGTMQSAANGTGSALFVALALLIAGATLVALLFPRGSQELRTYLLTYGICLFAGGMAQLYSRAFFGNPQSTIDANLFLQLLAPQPPFTSFKDLLPVNAPLAVMIWQQAYRLAWFLGLDFGPYLGVMCNALIMGIVGSLTVRIARELYGDDSGRLRLVGMLYACCGLFFLLGAILLRDAFTTLLNVVVLWALVRWLVRPRLRSLLGALAATVGSAYAMAYLRVESVPLFGLFWLLAFLCWSLREPRRKGVVLAVVAGAGVVLIAVPQLRDYARMLHQIQSLGLENYAEKVAQSHAESPWECGSS